MPGLVLFDPKRKPVLSPSTLLTINSVEASKIVRLALRLETSTN
jgi:hypothetical protein